MRSIWFAHACLMSLVIGVPASHAADVKEVIEKAIKAHGGEANLAKSKLSSMKGKGTVDIMGISAEFTLETTTALPDRRREEIKLEIMGQALTIVQVVNKDKAWQSTMGNVMDLADHQLADQVDQVWHEHLATLTPLLKEAGIKTEVVGESMVDGKPAIGIKISAKGHKDLTMHFDKESGLLVKQSARGHNPQGEEVDVENFMSGYKDFGGLKQATKMKIMQEGKKFIEFEVTEFKVLDKVDDESFKRP